jgi:hypothetical protein
LPEPRRWRLGEHDVATTVATALNQRLSAPLGESRNRALSSYFLCAEEDSNLHPPSVDQALNLVTRVSYPSYASIASRTSGNLDTSDVVDDLDVATDVAGECPPRRS